jgi:hypothetical protein
MSEALDDFTDADVLVADEDVTAGREPLDPGEDEIVAGEAAPEEGDEAQKWVEANSRQGRDGKPFFTDEAFRQIIRPEIEQRFSRMSGKLHEKDEMLAQLAQELDDHRRWRASVEASTTDTDLGRREAEARAKLKQARLDDSTDDEVAALDALAEVKAQRIAAVTSRTQQAAAQAQVRQAPPQQPTVLPDAMQGWLDRNPWYDANGTDQRSKRAQQEFEALLQDYQPNSARLYAELDQRLASAGGANSGKAPALSAANPGKAPAQGQRKPRGLTAQDLRDLRDIHGLDPKNPQVQKDYLAAKISAEREA